MKRFLPWIILAFAVVLIAPSWMPPKTAQDDFDFRSFGKIPVLVGGRMRNVARVCALWTLAVGTVVIVVRYWRFEHRWFILTGAALLQAALHGLAGISYLLSGLIAVVVAAIAIGISYTTRSRAESSHAT